MRHQSFLRNPCLFNLSSKTTMTPRFFPRIPLTYRHLHSQAHPRRSASASATAAVLKQRPPPPPLASTAVDATRSPDLDRLQVPFSRIDPRKVVVGFESGDWGRFHHVWLRDHCRCPQCYHPVTKQRLVNTFEIPHDVKPIKVESKKEGLEVTWPAAAPHTSFFPWSWLKYHSYDPPLREPEPSNKVLWGSKIERSPPTVTYTDVMSGDDKGLLKWLSHIDKFGFCFVSGVPPTAEATEELVTRIGFIRETQYGKFWDFTADLARGDTAYTNLALSAHTDNTYFTDPCGLQLFHLVSHTEGTGGSTLLVDGFYVASLLKELHPTAYDILTRVGVPAHAAGEAGNIYIPSPSGRGKGYYYPVLKEVQGEVVQVRWNNDDRSVMSGLGPEELEQWYDAIRLWNKFLTSADSEYWVQLTPGTVIAIDNHRVLHGRSAFTGKRRMCGAYIGMDEYRSKLAVLRERYEPDDVEKDTMGYALVNGRSLWSSMV